jgi:hypothetical protein
MTVSAVSQSFQTRGESKPSGLHFRSRVSIAADFNCADLSMFWIELCRAVFRTVQSGGVGFTAYCRPLTAVAPVVEIMLEAQLALTFSVEFAYHRG